MAGIMSAVKTLIPTDRWVEMDWDTFVSQSEDPALEKAKAYYHKGHGRFEMLPVGFKHGVDHVLTAMAINLYGILKLVPIQMTDSCSYQKAGYDTCQPDLSAYLGDRASLIPATSGIVNLDRYPTPDLAIEISNTTLLDDLGSKRSLYEELNFAEYWVVDVKKAKASAFKIADKGSQRIRVSLVLPGFELAVLEEALQKSKELDQSQVGAWLMEQFQR